MNVQEREEYVIQIYKEGWTVREIAGLAHMSFRDTGAIINKASCKQTGKEDSRRRYQIQEKIR